MSTNPRYHSSVVIVGLVLAFALVCIGNPLCDAARAASGESEPRYEYRETQQLVSLVNAATERVRREGENAFGDFRRSPSRWRQQETYVFVLDPDGKMVVHPDPAMEGKNEIDLKDIEGKPIIRGLIDAATATAAKSEGWYHYQWPVPGGLLPRWKSSYVRLATTPSGKRYIVGAGMYNDRMERSFAVDSVKDAVARIEKDGKYAFSIFHDPKGPFIAKDTYLFVIDSEGVNLVHPAFPNLEGRSLLGVKDTHGKYPIREMLELVKKQGAGWVDYMWPKPGESVSTQKSTYVSKARLGDTWVLVGCGIYLGNAPKSAQMQSLTPPGLMQLVRDGAALLEKRGEQAYSDFRKKGSKWFRDDTYFFVWNMDGTRAFHAADPSLEGKNGSNEKDIRGRPYGKMFLDAAQGPSGEGWVHYMFPEPDKIFPAWKSTFLKRVRLPSGKQQILGCGIYYMQMDQALIEGVVDRAAELIEKDGKKAFLEIRDKSGPFVFMDTYVFVQNPDGVELVNPAQPSLEGRNLIDLKDLKGKPVVRDEIDLAMKQGRAWLDVYWYRPGTNEPAPKHTYVRRVKSGDETFIVGSGLYSR